PHHHRPGETSTTPDPRHQRIPPTMREAVKKRLQATHPSRTGQERLNERADGCPAP
ncbi:hypothetical protein ABIA31_009316, partial [Catenulispora sp. MAP5-51]